MKQKGPRGRKDHLHKATGGGDSANLHGNSPELRAALRASGFVEVNDRGFDKRGNSIGAIPLIYAARKGLSTIVRALIDQGDTVSITDDAGFSALHMAAHHDHAEIARMLARAGSDLDAATLEGDTPLHLATSYGNTEVVGALIEEGASVNSRNPGGATPLYVAAMGGHLGAAKKLLLAGANSLLTWSNSSGKSFVPLDVAVQTGRSAVVRELLRQRGIGGCGGQSGGSDALRQAAVFGQIDSIAMLMDAGVVDTGRALIEAVGSCQEASVAYLLRRQKERPGARQASYVNNARNDRGATPLLVSFLGCPLGKVCNPRITRRLIDAGAETSSAVLVRCNRIPALVRVTPLEYLTAWVPGEQDETCPATTDEHLHRWEAIRRLLLQVEAVHAISWLWPGNATLLARPAKGTRRTAEPASTPLTMMLPVLKRRARRRSLLSETLFR